MVPDATSLYRLYDVRGYEGVINAREYDYWSHADSGFQYNPSYLWLYRPDIRWLEAAGVSYVMAAGRTAPPGTTLAYRGEGVTIGRVPRPRPFAFAARSTVTSSNRYEALRRLLRDPLGPVVVEGACCRRLHYSPTRVTVVSRRAGAVDLDVLVRRRPP
jgi:hypothetical protein